MVTETPSYKSKYSDIIRKVKCKYIDGWIIFGFFVIGTVKYHGVYWDCVAHAEWLDKQERGEIGTPNQKELV